MDDHKWVVIEQNEGLMVDYKCSNGVDVWFVDYNEAAENEEYLNEKIVDAARYMASGMIPQNVALNVMKYLLEIKARDRTPL